MPVRAFHGSRCATSTRVRHALPLGGGRRRVPGPHGKLTLVTYLALVARKTPIGWWTVDSGDTFDELPDPRSVTERIVRDSGGVVLLHDFDRSRDRMDYVLRTTEMLLQASKREGLRIVRMRDLLAELVHVT